MSKVEHEDNLLTTKEAADLLGVSVATINRWADKGDLTVAAKAPGLRGARLFRRIAVEDKAAEAAA